MLQSGPQVRFGFIFQTWRKKKKKKKGHAMKPEAPVPVQYRGQTTFARNGKSTVSRYTYYIICILTEYKACGKRGLAGRYNNRKRRTLTRPIVNLVINKSCICDFWTPVFSSRRFDRENRPRAVYTHAVYGLYKIFNTLSVVGPLSQVPDQGNTWFRAGRENSPRGGGRA